MLTNSRLAPRWRYHIGLISVALNKLPSMKYTAICWTNSAATWRARWKHHTPKMLLTWSYQKFLITPSISLQLDMKNCLESTNIFLKVSTLHWRFLISLYLIVSLALKEICLALYLDWCNLYLFCNSWNLEVRCQCILLNILSSKLKFTSFCSISSKYFLVFCFLIWS